ncbi:MAG: FHA domain-containing protein, partial [Planctomycetota bacterium]
MTQAVTTLAKLKILTGTRAGLEMELGADNHVIGSDEGSSVTCMDPDVEWSHAGIYREVGKYWIEDLQSRSGVYVNGRRILHRSLRDGDKIQVGSVTIEFRFEGSAFEGAAPTPSAGVTPPPALAVSSGLGAEASEFVRQVAEQVVGESGLYPAAATAEAPSSGEEAARPGAPTEAPSAGPAPEGRVSKIDEALAAVQFALESSESTGKVAATLPSFPVPAAADMTASPSP